MISRLACWIASAIVAWTSVVCSAASGVTQQRAVERARKFLAEIGTDLPLEPPTVSRTVEGWRVGAWKVGFGAGLHVEVAETSGKVVGAWDSSAVPRAAAPAPLTREQALEFAAKYIEAAGGLPEDAVLQRVNPLPPTQQQRPAGWQVIWIRFHGAYRYLDDSLNVQVRATDGRLIGYANNFVTPPPESLHPLVSRSEAEREAGRSFGAGNPAGAGLVIIDPDRLVGRRRPLRSVLAWQVAFEAGGDAIVDATTGAVLSVTQPTGTVPLQGKAGIDIRRALAKATRIEISNERRHFGISTIDLRHHPERRRALIACIGREPLPDNSQYLFSVRARLLVPGARPLDFWVRTADRNKPAIRESGPHGRARLWLACPRLLDLLEIPWFHGTTRSHEAKCPDVRQILERAHKVRLERVVYSLQPVRAEREDLTLNIRGRGLGPGLAALVDPVPYLYYEPSPLVSERCWELHITRDDSPVAHLFWERGGERGLLYIAPTASQRPVCAWETAGPEFRDLLIPAESDGSASPESGAFVVSMPPEPQQTGDTSRLGLWLWIVLAGFLVAVTAACAVWARARRQA